MHPRFALVSPTGYGNLGDEAIIHSLIYAIRRRIPDAEVVGFTQNPSDTARRHCIAAYTCSGVSIPGYKVTDRVSDRTAPASQIPCRPSRARTNAPTLPVLS